MNRTNRAIRRGIGICLCLWCLWNLSLHAQARDWNESVMLDEVQDTFEQVQPETGNFSIREYVEQIVSGNTGFSMRYLLTLTWNQLQEEFSSQKNTFVRILALGILSGILINFAGTIGEQGLGDTGIYLVYLLLFSVVSVGFYASYELTKETVSHLLVFMKTLVPSFSLALSLGGGTGTSLAYYETMLIAISLMESWMLYILLPGTQIYFCLGMINPLIDNRFSRMAELIKSILSWSVKIFVGILLGYQGIQGMILPVMDRIKENAVLKAAKGLPGVGNTVGSLADTVVGSGILLKSAIGAGGVICLCVIAIYPILKIGIFYAVHQVGGAPLQPVSDRRMIVALKTTAESGKLLLEYVLIGTLLFVFSILIVLTSVNYLS